MSESKTPLKLTWQDWLGIVSVVLGVPCYIYYALYPTSTLAFTFVLVGGFLIFESAYFFYKFLEKIAVKKKQEVGSLWLAFVVSLIVIDLYVIFTPASDLEESSVSWRFNLVKGGITKSEKESDEGTIEYIKYNPPEDARRDIQIIGITTNTLEQLEGQWPLPWKYYASVIEKFKSTTNHLMFDIFFVDYKPGQTDEMAKALTGNPRVMFDYPMETSLESKSAIINLESRIDILRKFKLENVQDSGDVGQSWLKFPQPPIEPVGDKSSGLGFANIKKDESGLNRRMPIVAKLYNSGPYKETEYYPSIDLVIACNYFGVDIKKDVEVVMGKYVKIKNIPKKEITNFNFKTMKRETNDIMAKPNEKREITIPIDEFGQMEINFAGGLYSFKNTELFEVAKLWEADTAAQYENNIFLVAMYYATGRGAAKDTHLSPFGDMSGIEHHAHAINTILNQDFLREFPTWANFLIFLIVGLIVGLVQPRLKTALGFAFIVVFAILYSVLTLINFSEFNIVHVFPMVLMEQAFIFVGITGYKILTEEENVKYIRSTFSKFVSKDVVDELLKNPDNLNLGGSKRDITIFFSDIRGFTTMSEKMGPEELVQFLNQYLSEMTEIIIEFKGTIDKYMGDAIMAFWGAPVPLEDHAYYACAASIAQMRRLAALKEEWKSRDLPVMDIGIGLNSGPAVVGNMGSSHRMDFTCMGDTINLGSRLEGSNKEYGTHIIISEYTYEKVKDRIVARELDLVKVKGKTKPVRIYELIDLVNEEDLKHLRRPLQEAEQS
ncbi:adenylate/guanylate cyclase domain-containing protein [Leptospira perolatii]|uniref:Adenylate/guanylate cyclase domain-containing protein n=1 Tax=Leptospira perolatii TaxID=2023191 RepID=A0A2M9ZK14_9LEPT|nr:CHASE2 domain-containing protein [Leptospira perolatii]PJZ69203.1 adenylate/guanylate cyclase domain-containing protein [Leptospira perolatii]PJZ72415.1 adenylate/guanylate cyclase domain-containing protein [Leptospira perolatii]